MVATSVIKSRLGYHSDTTHVVHGPCPVRDTYRHVVAQDGNMTTAADTAYPCVGMNNGRVTCDVMFMIGKVQGRPGQRAWC